MSANPLQRAWRVLREEGWRSFWFKLLGDLGYRRLCLLECSLTEPIQVVKPKLAIDLDWLKPNELDEYLAVQPVRTRELFADRLTRGDCCLIARHQGRIVAGMWACRHQARITYLERELRLADGEVYTFDAFTAPEFRGQAIAPALSTELLRRFRDAGCQRALRATAPENQSALRAHAKAGFRPYARIGYLKLGPWRREFFRDRHRGLVR